MKKLALFFVLCFSFLRADGVEDLKQHVCNELYSLHGWCTREKALNFIDLVLEVKPQVCVEIGVFGGRALFPVASTLKYLGQGVVIGIDPWDKIECMKYFEPTDNPQHVDWWGKVDFNFIYRAFLDMLRKYKLEKYCQAMKSTSEKAAPKIETIDILYIDGNHAEQIALQDVQLYLPKVRQGGYIWMNDTTWTSLQPAVELLTENCDVIKLIDNGNCILFKKR